MEKTRALKWNYLPGYPELRVLQFVRILNHMNKYAQEMARARWKKTTKKQRREVGKMLAESRAKARANRHKVPAVPCG